MTDDITALNAHTQSIHENGLAALGYFLLFFFCKVLFAYQLKWSHRETWEELGAPGVWQLMTRNTRHVSLYMLLFRHRALQDARLFGLSLFAAGTMGMFVFSLYGLFFGFDSIYSSFGQMEF